MLAVFFLRLLASTRVVARSIATDTTEAACTASISISIAFMSCLQMLSLVVMPSWGGKGWSLAVYILRWMNCALTVLACIGLLDMFVMSIRSEGGLAGSLTGGATPSHHGADVGRRRRDALPVRRAERRAESADDVRGTHRDWTGVANGPGVRCAVSGQVAPAVGGTRGLASRVSPGADVLAHGAVRALGTE
ncbi:hypothetical protein J3459_006525 [Metarhizium acridum]|uniref:Uncharacterized protein n=2 Tax=Metarhizium acridum TaxID=92637 RepID=E9E1B8_METAQ|nr:uncharacterized protein MAC_03666 [Metarhizium acridum CQMa 102]EFY90420.1 hypothetical protein MAC_03666 [Metarhizium acridum CQMa 102]KAG8427600.1 hypothetical protein J3459_006525 [Metarhizium acridum]